jgi:cytochrome c-type biogenesis protein CcmH/NrfG
MQLRLGDALNRADRLEDSAVALERALGEEPDNRRAWHLYGRVLDRLERPDDAVRAYRRAQGIDA